MATRRVEIASRISIAAPAAHTMMMPPERVMLRPPLGTGRDEDRDG